jgi:NAD(P)H-dependent flavin oxidoreductase YrpB (nitropropane dioxygenase family)
MSALHTRICDLFGIRYPIVQTGMGWVAGPRLTAATSTAGGLGILASATMTLPELRAAIADVKRRTDRPFGVNLRTDQGDIVERVELLVAEQVKVASFAQAPSRDLIKRLKDGGVLTMPTVGQKRHAEKVASWGVDAIIAQGHEGGGHTGPIPTTLLLPSVIDAVDVPVLGAGGFFDGRGLVAALAYGASGIAMGTRFLLTLESTVPEAVKKIYLNTPLTGTVVTRSVDGVPQRLIATDFIARLEHAGRLRRLLAALWHGWRFRKLTRTPFFALLKEAWSMRRHSELTLAQTAMAAAAPMLTRAALVEGKPEVGILPTGQNVGVIEELPTVAELIARIVAEAEAVLQALSQPAPTARPSERRLSS